MNSNKIQTSKKAIFYTTIGKNQYVYDKKERFSQKEFENIFEGKYKVFESASLSYSSKNLIYCPIIPFEKDSDIIFLMAYKEMLGILTYVFNFEIYPIFDKKTLEKLNKKIEYSYLITEFSTLSGAAIEADDQKIIDLVPNQSSSGKSYILDMENKSNSCPIDVVPIIYNFKSESWRKSAGTSGFEKISQNLEKEIKQNFPRINFLKDTSSLLTLSPNRLNFLFLKIQSEVQYFLWREIHAITLFLFKNNYYYFSVLDLETAPVQSYIHYDSDIITVKNDDKWFEPYRRTLVKVLSQKIPTQMIKFCDKIAADPKISTKLRDKLKQNLRNKIKLELNAVYLDYNLYEEDLEEIKAPKPNEIFAPIFYITQQDQIQVIEGIFAVLVEIQRWHQIYKFCVTVCCDKDIYEANKSQIDRIGNLIVIISSKTEEITFYENKNLKRNLKANSPETTEPMDDLSKIVYFCTKEVNENASKKSNIVNCIMKSFKIPALKEFDERKDEEPLYFSSEDKEVSFSERNNIFYFAVKINEANLILFKIFMRGLLLLNHFNYKIYPIAISTDNLESKLANYKCFLIQGTNIIPIGYEITRERRRSFLDKINPFSNYKEAAKVKLDIDLRRSFVEYTKRNVASTFAGPSPGKRIESEPDIPVLRSGSMTERTSETSKHPLFVEDVKYDFTGRKSLLIMDYDLAFVDESMKRILNKHDLKCDKKVSLYNFDMKTLNDYDIVLFFLHQKGRFNEVTIEKAKEVAKKFTKEMIYVVYFHLENIGFDPLDLVNSKNEVIYSMHVNYETKGEFSMDSQITYKLGTDSFKVLENFIKETLDQ